MNRMNNVSKIAIALAISLSVMSSYAAKNDSGEKIDLTEIEARVSALEAELADRQLIGGDKYEGTYTTTVTEVAFAACQTVDDLASVLGDSEGTGEYLLAQEGSEINVRSATYDVESTGGVLTPPSGELEDTYTSYVRGMDLNGADDVGDRQEGFPPQMIDPDGVISIPGATPDQFSGQFSADGSMYTFIARFANPEGDCEDVGTIMGVGVRK